MANDATPGTPGPGDYADPEPPGGDGPRAGDFCRGCGEENGMADPPFCDGWCRDCRCPNCETPLEDGPRRRLCETCALDERDRAEERAERARQREDVP
jgi:hypothetical protein